MNSDNINIETFVRNNQPATENPGILEIRQKANACIKKLQDYNKKMVDKKRKGVQDYKEGDFVVLKTNFENKLSKKFRGPYVIKKKLPNDRYLITDIDDFQVTHLPFSSVCSPNNMRRWISNSDSLVNYGVNEDIDGSG